MSTQVHSVWSSEPPPVEPWFERVVPSDLLPELPPGLHEAELLLTGVGRRSHVRRSEHPVPGPHHGIRPTDQAPDWPELPPRGLPLLALAER